MAAQVDPRARVGSVLFTGGRAIGTIGALAAVFTQSEGSPEVVVRTTVNGRRRVVGTRQVQTARAGALVTFRHATYGPISLRIVGGLANFTQHGRPKLRSAIISYRTARGTEVPLGSSSGGL